VIGYYFPSIRLFFSKRRSIVSLFLFVFFVFLAALNTGNNLIYLVSSFIVSIIFISYFLAWISLHKNKIVIDEPEIVFVNDRAYFRISVKNKKKKFATKQILVELIGNFKIKEDDVMGVDKVNPGETRTSILTLVFSRRGRYSIKGVRLTTTYPFGIFSHSIKVSFKRQLIVAPSIREVNHLIDSYIKKHDITQSKRRGQSFDLLNIREYSPGDDFRFMHWKASAKLSQLMIKEFYEYSKGKIVVVMDNFKISPDYVEFKEKFEEALITTASFIDYFLWNNYALAFLTFEDYIDFGTGESQMKKIFFKLADLSSVKSRKKFDSFIDNVEEETIFIIVGRESTAKKMNIEHKRYYLFNINEI